MSLLLTYLAIALAAGLLAVKLSAAHRKPKVNYEILMQALAAANRRNTSPTHVLREWGFDV